MDKQMLNALHKSKRYPEPNADVIRKYIREFLESFPVGTILVVREDRHDCESVVSYDSYGGSQCTLRIPLTWDEELQFVIGHYGLHVEQDNVHRHRLYLTIF